MLSAMKATTVENYTVRLGSNGFFKFDGMRIDRVLFPNIRSITGKIGGLSFNKEALASLIKKFLTVPTNVELVNILSRELNHFNYFEIYNQTSDLLSKDEVFSSENTQQLQSSEVNSSKVEELKLSDELGKDDPDLTMPGRYLDCSKSNSSKIGELKLSDVLGKDEPSPRGRMVFELYQRENQWWSSLHTERSSEVHSLIDRVIHSS